MANGNPGFDFEQCEGFFAPIADCIAQFAGRRNLALVKYDHDSPYWDLLFAHPIGGQAKLVLGPGGSNGVALSAVAWLDHYDSFTRFVRWSGEREVSAHPAELSVLLNQLLDEVLCWRLDGQFRAVGGYGRIWSTISREEFLASQPALPTPTSAGS